MPRRPVVVIAGRPNVGKSSLLNRVVGRRIAVVEEHPGVTRDRKNVDAEWNGVPFELIDTGGWMVGGDALDEKVSAQAEAALASADLILVIVDAAVGVTDEDVHIARVTGDLGIYEPGAGRAHPDLGPSWSGNRRSPRSGRRPAPWRG